jgi:hypothetical protein
MPSSLSTCVTGASCLISLRPICGMRERRLSMCLLKKGGKCYAVHEKMVAIFMGTTGM